MILLSAIHSMDRAAGLDRNVHLTALLKLRLNGKPRQPAMQGVDSFVRQPG
jgi:hypothetical protein